MKTMVMQQVNTLYYFSQSYYYNFGYFCCTKNS